MRPRANLESELKDSLYLRENIIFKKLLSTVNNASIRNSNEHNIFTNMNIFIKKYFRLHFLKK